MTFFLSVERYERKMWLLKKLLFLTWIFSMLSMWWEMRPNGPQPSGLLGMFFFFWLDLGISLQNKTLPTNIFPPILWIDLSCYRIIIFFLCYYHYYFMWEIMIDSLSLLHKFTIFIMKNMIITSFITICLYDKLWVIK